MEPSVDYDPLNDDVDNKTLRILISNVIQGELRSIRNIRDWAGEITSLDDFLDLGMEAIWKSINRVIDFSALIEYMADNNSQITF